VVFFMGQLPSKEETRIGKCARWLAAPPPPLPAAPGRAPTRATSPYRLVHLPRETCLAAPEAAGPCSAARRQLRGARDRPVYW